MKWISNHVWEMVAMLLVALLVLGMVVNTVMLINIARTLNSERYTKQMDTLNRIIEDNTQLLETEWNTWYGSDKEVN